MEICGIDAWCQARTLLIDYDYVQIQEMTVYCCSPNPDLRIKAKIHPRTAWQWIKLQALTARTHSTTIHYAKHTHTHKTLSPKREVSVNVTFSKMAAVAPCSPATCLVATAAWQRPITTSTVYDATRTVTRWKNLWPLLHNHPPEGAGISGARFADIAGGVNWSASVIYAAICGLGGVI